MWEKIAGKNTRKAGKPGQKSVRNARPTRDIDVSPSEATEQEMLFQWAQYASAMHPELNTLYHIANEGGMGARRGYNRQKQGVKAGVPDICLPVPKGKYGALYIELKRRSGGHVSDAQKRWIAMLNHQGNRAVVCKGFDEAREEIERYLGF